MNAVPDLTTAVTKIIRYFYNFLLNASLKPSQIHTELFTLKKVLKVLKWSTTYTLYFELICISFSAWRSGIWLDSSVDSNLLSHTGSLRSAVTEIDIEFEIHAYFSNRV